MKWLTAQIGAFLAGPAGRHMTTFCAIIGLAWMIGKPHAEEFVKRAVDQRITVIEQTQQEIEKSLHELQVQQAGSQADLEALKAGQKAVQDTQAQQQQLLIDIWRTVRQ